MLAAMMLEELGKQAPNITKKQLTDFYKLIYNEAYKEGREDAKIACGCQEED